MPSTGPLLCVGFQRGVLPALKKLGRPTYVLLPRGAARPEAAEVAGWSEIDLHDEPEPILEKARELLGGRPPAAVLALAERTVLAAARLREEFGLPGNDTTVALRCADKVEMKRALNAAGVPVAAWCEVSRQTTAKELVAALGLPLVLKPRRDSGGRGQSRFDDEAGLAKALVDLFAQTRGEASYGWLAEGWVEGVEMSVETFVHKGRVVFENPTEYFVPRHANILPAALDPSRWSEIREFGQRALRATGVERGITHMEVFSTAEGLVFGEMAIRAPGGRLMQLLKRAWGFDPWEASARLEVGEAFGFPEAPRRCAGVWILHPGSGRVASVEGLQEVRSLPGVRRVSLKIAPGDKIGERIGSGQDVGSIYAEAATRDEVAVTLTRAHELLQIQLA